MPDLGSLLGARSIAVVGASDRPGSFGAQVLRNLIELGYPGAAYPVHPRLGELFGRPCFADLGALPARPDCVALAVANHHLLPLLEQSAALEIPAAVVFGDPTVGPGRDPDLQGRLRALALQHDLAVCGPNAMGIYALHRKLVVSGYPVRGDLPAGNVALITHSGTVFDAMSQNNRDVAFNYVISCGNEAVLTAADYLGYALDDPTTRVVALYLETVRDPAGFIGALGRAAEKQIPIVALKTGSSERGRAMAQAHSGALAGGAEAYAALFDRFGVCQVRTLDEMMDTVELFSRVRPGSGTEVSMLMESGGERSLVVDLAVEAGIRFAELREETRRALGDTLDEGVTPDNPLDAFGTGADVVGVYRQCLLTLDADPGTGLLVLAVDLARDSYLSPAYVEAALGAYPDLHHPLVGMVNLSAGANEGLMAKLRAHGVPVLMGTETGLHAIAHLLAHERYRTRPAETPQPRGRPARAVVEALRARLRDAEAPLDEYSSKRVLAAYGLPVTREALVETPAQAVGAAEALGYPVALKTAAPGVLHKSEVGGIRLGLANAAAVREAYAQVQAQCGPRALVQEMARAGTEMILGMKADPQLGALILVGLGGIFVEVYRDLTTGLAPLASAQAERMLDGLRGKALLEGTRGRPPADRTALLDALLRFSTLITDLGDLLQEVDINPLLVREDGVLALDALIVPAGR